MSTVHSERLLTFGKHRFIPGKIVCVGQNYTEHIRELGSQPTSVPVIFCKPASAVAQQISLPSGCGDCHFEAELSFLIIGGELRAVALGLDLTLRDLQKKLKTAGHPWERAKAFDGSAYFSEFVDLPGSLDRLSLELLVNGQLRQRGGVSGMIHSPMSLLNEVQSFLTLDDYDVLMTGTPAGVGPLAPGDTLTGRVMVDDQVMISTTWTVE